MNFDRFDDIDRQHRDANIESIFYYAVFYPAIEAVSALASALIIWYGGASVIGGTVSLGALTAFLQYSQRFFRPISDMSEKFNVLQSAMASSERIFKLLDEKGAHDMIVIAGGVMPDEDVAQLKEMGVAEVLLQDTPPDFIVSTLNRLVTERGER